MQRVLPRIGRALYKQRGLGVGILAGITVIGAVPMFRPMSPDAIPFEGFPVDSSISGRLAGGGRILVVSETCESCLLRAEAFVRATKRDQKTLLLVSVSDSAGEGRFRQLTASDPQVSARTIFVTPFDVMGFIGVRAVPVHIMIDDMGRVVSSGRSRIGFFGSIASPSNWIEGWRRGLTGDDEASLF